FQAGIPWALGPLLPDARRIEPGEAPDRPRRRRPRDVDVRDEARRQHRADAVLRFRPAADDDAVGVDIHRTRDEALEDREAVEEIAQQLVRLPAPRPDPGAPSCPQAVV